MSFGRPTNRSWLKDKVEDLIKSGHQMADVIKLTKDDESNPGFGLMDIKMEWSYQTRDKTKDLPSPCSEILLPNF